MCVFVCVCVCVCFLDIVFIPKIPNLFNSCKAEVLSPVSLSSSPREERWPYFSCLFLFFQHFANKFQLTKKT